MNVEFSTEMLVTTYWNTLRYNPREMYHMLQGREINLSHTSTSLVYLIWPHYIKLPTRRLIKY